MIVVILAGGGGSRLWPFSRVDYPKQFLHFGDDLSFLQKTALRFYKSNIVDEILISTNKQYADLVSTQLNEIDPSLSKHLVIEPCQRNTAPALALCVRYILDELKADQDSPILILPSDHILDPESEFLLQLEKVESNVKKGSILTFGIRPNKPETGYGYIQLGKNYEKSLYEVRSFVEKPDKKRAEEYVSSKDYLWNSGMFAFTTRSFLQELKIYAPEIYELSQSLLDLEKSYLQMPDISIDYALMEKTKNLSVCSLDLAWSDVGSWDSVYEILDKDENQNVKLGDVVDIDTSNSLIFADKRLISTIGLKDMLIVETKDAIFLAKKGESQRVKSLIKKLQGQASKRGKKESYLVDKNHLASPHRFQYLACRYLQAQKKIEKIERITSLKDKKIWDFRGGSGTFSGLICEDLDLVCDLYDPSQASLDHANKIFNQRGTVSADLSVFDSDYDVITSWYVYGYLVDKQQFWNEIEQRLKPGGYFFLSLYNPRSIFRFFRKKTDTPNPEKWKLDLKHVPNSLRLEKRSRTHFLATFFKNLLDSSNA